ncbi:hypothetical protein Golomagni_05543 [Golovinomyces magnicellulatus]|nr:hypothetical protein Golomagni_05543 [Golovinomyces magnicellulatus]
MAGPQKSPSELDNGIKDSTMAQLALRLDGTSISARHIDCLDPDFWGQPIDKTSSVVERTTYAYGEYLFLLFKEEFAHWTSDMFGKIKSPFKKRFRDYLHNNGVYTGKKTTAIGPAIVTLLIAEEIPEWPQKSEKLVLDQQ